MGAEIKTMEKAFEILKRELTPKEYVLFMRAITPKFKDSTKELRKLTEKYTIEDVVKEVCGGE